MKAETINTPVVDIDLNPIKELMHEFTYNKGYHVGKMSVLFRKIAMELALHAFNQQEHEDYVNMDIKDYIYKLGRLADAMDEVNEIYNKQQP